jgi:hypothetical protein
MPSSVKEMLAEANAAVPRLDPGEVRNRVSRADLLIVDVRDASEARLRRQAQGVPFDARQVAQAFRRREWRSLPRTRSPPTGR